VSSLVYVYGSKNRDLAAKHDMGSRSYYKRSVVLSFTRNAQYFSFFEIATRLVNPFGVKSDLACTNWSSTNAGILLLGFDGCGGSRCVDSSLGVNRCGYFFFFCGFLDFCGFFDVFFVGD
jgi:hypothetical protein